MATLAAAIKMAAVVAARAQLSTEVSLHRLHLPPPAVEWVLSVLRAMLANQDSGDPSGERRETADSHTHTRMGPGGGSSRLVKTCTHKWKW